MKVYFSLFSLDICLFLGLITMIANWPEILFCVFFLLLLLLSCKDAHANFIHIFLFSLKKKPEISVTFISL